MSNFDANAETTAILAALGVLAGGRILESLPADANIPRNADGTCKPYIVLMSGTATAAASDRSFSGSERDQPQNMMWTVNCVAADAVTARTLRSAALNLLLGFDFGTGNATPLKGFGGYNVVDHATTTAPERVTMGTSLSTVLNLKTS